MTPNQLDIRLAETLFGGYAFVALTLVVVYVQVRAPAASWYLRLWMICLASIATSSFVIHYAIKHGHIDQIAWWNLPSLLSKVTIAVLVVGHAPVISHAWNLWMALKDSPEKAPAHFRRRISEKLHRGGHHESA